MEHTPFDDLARTPAHHFRLHYFAAVSHVLDQVAATFPTPEAAFEEFPFLVGYHEELARRDAAAKGSEWWAGAIAAWEKSASERLPIRTLREAAALDHRTITLLFAIGLNEEDGRFGLLFEALQAVPGLHRPTLGLLNAWWREPLDTGEVRRALRGLRELGIVEVANPEAPRIEWALQPQAAIWDALRGELAATPLPWLRYQKQEQLLTRDALIFPPAVHEWAEKVPALIERGDVRALIVRGPHHGSRRTLLGAIARELGRGTLEVNTLAAEAELRCRIATTLATVLHALPIVVIDPGPGETVELPPIAGADSPMAIVLGRHGGVAGPSVERSLTLTLEMPEPDLRRRHWDSCPIAIEPSDVEPIAERFRMTSGNIRRAASLAASQAQLARRKRVRLDDVREASRALNRQALDTLAVRVEGGGNWTHLAAGGETYRELMDLERRCRYREHLRPLVGPALSDQVRSGVRALFQGPSGTGKTLAARILGGVLGMDVYKVDLATVVNKYIGETEKNLGRIFSLAEELDVILLFDEGDALLAQRTAIQTSNDRYANLETNYLLQRIESYEGILLLTTNAGEHIDKAFQRRMDVVIDFRPPEAPERLLIWQLHLPPDHEVDPAMLRDIALRCHLSGGQIRNVVLHAAMLALEEHTTIRTPHIEQSIQREYRKSGAVYPLRRPTVVQA